ncbi:hypothetical protein CU633_19375 [Bacillus sp. V3-13]|nr:hypothetical protein CU633_19375 [Bacillus sp. V3-13]
MLTGKVFFNKCCSFINFVKIGVFGNGSGGASGHFVKDIFIYKFAILSKLPNVGKAGENLT